MGNSETKSSLPPKVKTSIKEEATVEELKVVIKKEDESVPDEALLLSLREDDPEIKKEDEQPILKTEEQDSETASTEAEPVWRPIRHPRLPVVTPARYYVNKHGDVCSKTSGELKPIKERAAISISYEFYGENRKRAIIKLEEIMAYTFHDDFDSATQYIFHRDGKQFNCSLDNLVICNLEKLQELEINRQQLLNDGVKYTVVKNVHDTFTFNRYLVSDTGYVYSIFNHNYLLLHRNAEGYLQVAIKPDTSSKHIPMTVHKIVISSFNGGPMGKLEIDHIDGSKLNNALSNLEYVTGSENTRRAYTPEQTSMRASLKDLGFFTKKLEPRPLPQITERTVWKTIGVIPWIGLSFNEYEVSDMGHVRRKGSPKVLAQRLDSKGYPRVDIRSDKQQAKNDNTITVASSRYSVYVSRLVANSFVDGYDETNNVVKRLNGDPEDNRAVNLKWVNQKAAIKRSARMVVATLMDDPASEKKFQSISKAEHELSINLHSKKIEKGSTLEKEVDWDGTKKMVLIKVF